MEPLLNIYIEPLKNGETTSINVSTSPDFLEIVETDLAFTTPIFFEGVAYIANNYLILELSIKTKAQIVCSICNTMTTMPIIIKNFVHTENLEQLHSSIFNYSSIAREEIILALPQFTECHEGKCPNRLDIAQYIKEKKSTISHNFPFTDL